MLRVLLATVIFTLISGCGVTSWHSTFNKDLALLDNDLKVITLTEGGTTSYEMVTPAITGRHPSGERNITLTTGTHLLECSLSLHDEKVQCASPAKLSKLKGGDSFYESVRSGVFVSRNFDSFKKFSDGKFVGLWDKGHYWLTTDRHHLFYNYQIYNADSMQAVKQINQSEFLKFKEYTARQFRYDGRLLLSNDIKHFALLGYNPRMNVDPAGPIGYIYHIESGKITEIPRPKKLPDGLKLIYAAEYQGSYYYLLEPVPGEHTGMGYYIYSYPDDKLIALPKTNISTRKVWDIANGRLFSTRISVHRPDIAEVSVIDYKKNISYEFIMDSTAQSPK